MYKILIVGLKGVDSGKTTLSRAVLSYMRDSGIEACGFKPMAGNNIWYNYDTICNSLSEGRLYGNDARLLGEVSKGDVPEELINPVHRLWSQPSSIDSPSGMPRFILDRITFWNGKSRTVLIDNCALNPKNGKLLDDLYNNADDICQIEDIEGLNNLVNRYYDRAIESAYRKLARRYEALVVEAYGDASLPWRGLEGLDLVLGVEPWRIFAYDPDRYLDAVNLSLTTYSREVATNRVTDLLEPMEVVDYLPSRSKERVDNLKTLIPPILGL